MHDKTVCHSIFSRYALICESLFRNILFICAPALAYICTIGSATCTAGTDNKEFPCDPGAVLAAVKAIRAAENR